MALPSWVVIIAGSVHKRSCNTPGDLVAWAEGDSGANISEPDIAEGIHQAFHCIYENKNPQREGDWSAIQDQTKAGLSDPATLEASVQRGTMACTRYMQLDCLTVVKNINSNCLCENSTILKGIEAIFHEG